MIEIENHANLPLAGVRRVTSWVFDTMEIENVALSVLDTKHWYHHGHFYAFSYGIVVLAYVPLEINGEIGYDRGLRNGPPIMYPENWQESLVCILAHEGTHVRQFRAGPRTAGYTQSRRGKVVHVSGRVFSEVEAEWAEYRYLKWWREE